MSAPSGGGSVPPTSPTGSSTSSNPRAVHAGYLAAMIGLVAVAVALVEFQFMSSPMPPGVDAGRWLTVSSAYAGLPYPPPATIGSPWVDPPLIFPFLGGLIRLFGGPLTAGFVFAGTLLALYGATVIHLARRFVRVPIFQVLLVGLALLNGTTLFMLFWGGYPNFAAFVLMNEAVVFLLAFVRTPRWTYALAAYGFAALVFLTHDLSFAILAGVFVSAGIVLLLARQISWRTILGRAHLAGVGLLVAVIVGYEGIVRVLHIVTPGYLSANPAAYTLTNIGQVLDPVTAACLCPTDNLDPQLITALLLALAVGLIAASRALRNAGLAVRERSSAATAGPPGGPWPRPPSGRFLTPEILVALAWVAATALVPAVGYLAHVDTDYSRFGYFFPLPALLLSITLVDRAAQPYLLGRPSPVGAAEPPPGSAIVASGRGRARRAPQGIAAIYVVVAVVLVVVFLTSTLPVTSTGEEQFTGNTHTPEFLEAMHWLQSNPQPGAVISLSTANRWVQALTARASYDIGPTWVLFYPWQILNVQETYWALNSRYAISNNQLCFLYSGNNTSAVLSAPTLTAFDQGVQFPLFRLTPASIFVNATHANVTRSYTPGTQGTAQIATTASPVPTGHIRFAGPIFALDQVDQLGGGGLSWMNFTVTPTAGNAVRTLSLGLTIPLTKDPAVHATSVGPLTAGGPWFDWTSVFHLGQLAGNQTLTTNGTFSPAPVSSLTTPAGAPTNLTVTFANPNPTSPLVVSLRLVTPGTSNPAVVVPTTFTSADYLAQKGIRFLLLPSSGGAIPTSTYFQAEFGFKPAYANSLWVILSR